MTIGTLFEFDQPKARQVLPGQLARFLKLDIKFGSVNDADYVKNFPLKKVPAYLGSDGLVLSEAIAINVYFASLAPKSNLLGETKEDYASILKWLSFGNSEVLPLETAAFSRLIGREPYNKKIVDQSLADLEPRVNIIEKQLLHHTYLVGESVSLADLYVVTMFWRGFCFLFGNEWRSSHPNIVRWYNTVTKQPILKDFFEKHGVFIEKQVEPVFPKKEKTEKKPAAEPKKKEVKEDEAEDEKPAEPEQTSVLKALGPAKSFPIDEWKRTYSNKETREEALPWFWQHYDPNDYSLYKVAYKYNDDLTLTFMSNNLIGGFFNRLTASIKYLFGCMVVYGENNNNGIVGVFLVRGDDYLPAFEVAPDMESFEFTKLDPSKPETKEYVNDLWAWDAPLEIDGKKREIADGKVFK